MIQFSQIEFIIPKSHALRPFIVFSEIRKLKIFQKTRQFDSLTDVFRLCADVSGQVQQHGPASPHRTGEESAPERQETVGCRDYK